MRNQENNRRDFRSALACLALGAGVYVLVLVAAYFTQAAIIFHSGGLAPTPPGGFAIETVRIPSDAGLMLNAWWLYDPRRTTIVLYFQGNRYRPSDLSSRLRAFERLGCNALIFDYRGFGQSAGRIQREADLYADGLAAWNYLRRTRGIPSEAIILWGRSLGGAVAAHVARDRTAAALVLESTFHSMDEMARLQYPWLPTGRLLRFHFRSGAHLESVRMPVLVVHSPEDDYIPLSQAQRLFHSAPEPKAMVLTSGGHLDLVEQAPAAWPRFAEALNRLTGGRVRHAL